MLLIARTRRHLPAATMPRIVGAAILVYVGVFIWVSLASPSPTTAWIYRVLQAVLLAGTLGLVVYLRNAEPRAGVLAVALSSPFGQQAYTVSSLILAVVFALTIWQLRPTPLD